MNKKALVSFVIVVVIIVAVVNYTVVTNRWSLQGADNANEDLIKLKELNITLAALKNELLSLQNIRDVINLTTTPAAAIPAVATTPVKKKYLTQNLNSNDHSSPFMKKKNVMIFTMDSIGDYEKNSKRGGAAGIYLSS